MSRRVFVHIGLPKTGTSYLQLRLWRNRAALREAGLLLPGRARRDHLLSSMVVRDDPRLHRRRGVGAHRAWSRVQRDLAAFEGDGLVTHEFFCSASRDQAQRMVAELAPAEVHLVVTAREPLGLFVASWQESLKNMGTTPLRDYAAEVSEDPAEVWNWRALDLDLVLQRWGETVPPDRVHVVTLPPPDAPRDQLWERFSSVLGVASEVVGEPPAFVNQSMGLVEAETLRRVNLALQGRWSAYDRARWIRSFLADQRLVPRRGERFWPDQAQIQDCRDRGERAVERLRAHGFDAVGDLDSLLVPQELPQRRHPDSVTDTEVAEVAVALVAQLLHDVRERSVPRAIPEPSSEPRPSTDAAPAAPAPRWRRAAARVRSVLPGS